jgi:GntR family transcriptional regulator
MVGSDSAYYLWEGAPLIPASSGMPGLDIPVNAHQVRTSVQPLYTAARNALIQLVETGEFPGNRLPSEEALCELLGVSRATVREALVAMNRDGLITKLHGSGNVIHKKSLKARMRIDKITDFMSLLQDGGYTVRRQRSQLKWVDNISDYGITVHGEHGERYLFIEHIHFADEAPAIVARNFIRESVSVPISLEKIAGLSDSFSTMLNSICREPLANSITTFDAIQADAEMAALLTVPESTSLIRWIEEFFSIYDTTLCHSITSYHPGLVRMTMLRRWL